MAPRVPAGEALLRRPRAVRAGRRLVPVAFPALAARLLLRAGRDAAGVVCSRHAGGGKRERRDAAGRRGGHAACVPGREERGLRVGVCDRVGGAGDGGGAASP